MSDVEWWLKYGWYDLALRDFSAALVLAAVLVLVAAHQHLSHQARDRRGRGVLASLPIAAWALLACRQAINTSQMGTAGHHARYSQFLWCILASALVGVVVSGSTFVSDRLLTPAGPYSRPSRGVVVCNAVALAVWLAIWTWAFVYEAGV